MGYFNFPYILKNILYNLRGCFKYIFMSILLLTIIVLSLILLDKGVFAYDGSAFTEEDIEMLDAIREAELQNLANNGVSFDSYTYTLWYDGYPRYLYEFI